MIFCLIFSCPSYFFIITLNIYSLYELRHLKKSVMISHYHYIRIIADPFQLHITKMKIHDPTSTVKFISSLVNSMEK